MHHQNTVR